MHGLEVLIPIVMFLVPVAIIKIVADNRIRNKLIDKGMVDEKAKYLYANQVILQPLASFKWGLVLIGIGLAFFIGNIWDLHEELVVGLMFILAGLGFFVYYFLATREIKNNPNTKL